MKVCIPMNEESLATSLHDIVQHSLSSVNRTVHFDRVLTNAQQAWGLFVNASTCHYNLPAGRVRGVDPGKVQFMTVNDMVVGTAERNCLGPPARDHYSPNAPTAMSSKYLKKRTLRISMERNKISRTLETGRRQILVWR